MFMAEESRRRSAREYDKNIIEEVREKFVTSTMTQCWGHAENEDGIERDDDI